MAKYQKMAVLTFILFLKSYQMKKKMKKNLISFAYCGSLKCIAPGENLCFYH